MKPKTLGLLAAVVLILGAFIWFVEWDLPGSEERAERAKKVLGGVDRDAVEAVSISVGGRRVELERRTLPIWDDREITGEETVWYLTAPVEKRADEQAVTRLLSTLTRLEKQAPVEEPDRADLGLEPPQAVVTVRSNGRERTLHVGVEVPVTGDRVVTVDGRRGVWVTESELWDEISREPEAWRSKRAVPWSASEIVSLDWTRWNLVGDSLERESMDLIRRTPGEAGAARFYMSRPFVDAADPQAAQELTSRLATLQIADFFDGPEEAPEGVTLQNPRFSVSIYANLTGVPYTVELIAPVDETETRWIAEIDNDLVEIEAGEIVKLLDQPVSAWRSPLLAELRIFELDEVRIRSADGKEMVLARTEGDWSRDGEAVVYEPVRELLLQLTGARALEVEPAETQTLGEPRWVFTLEPNMERRSTETISIYPSGDEEVLARLEPRGVVLRFEPHVVDEIDAALENVREAAPVAVDSP